MRRIALVCAVIAALLLIDGLYMVLANYHPGDQNTFDGNQNVILSDGEVTLISSGFFILATAAIWIVALRREAASRARGAEREQAEAPGRRTASRTQ
jgi:uncharacterized membrane protein